ncbi:hypothetical protein E2C01_095515 [Portunus trituberculatus]|uniref:Uncharacterized protein n=1 Tax=Portunus trituberculatus TaxID=210409 RepID=A0A5B7K0E2_PORTR|nr:hypothetical protein [Portunus trituberculatus]
MIDTRVDHRPILPVTTPYTSVLLETTEACLLPQTLEDKTENNEGEIKVICHAPTAIDDTEGLDCCLQQLWGVTNNSFLTPKETEETAALNSLLAPQHFRQVSSSSISSKWPVKNSDGAAPGSAGPRCVSTLVSVRVTLCERPV